MDLEDCRFEDKRPFWTEDSLSRSCHTVGFRRVLLAPHAGSTIPASHKYVIRPHFPLDDPSLYQ